MFEEVLTLEEVLARYSDGPQTGVFADGSARPNPGPGGWGVVHVRDGIVLSQHHGHEPNTTNNRMELTALITGFKLLKPEDEIEVFTDSELCVNTITQWAKNWEKRGWKRSGGPIKNLELVKELYYLAQERPKVRLKWIKAHDGSLWNEYADSLATAWMRPRL